MNGAVLAAVEAPPYRRPLGSVADVLAAVEAARSHRGRGEDIGMVRQDALAAWSRRLTAPV